MFICSFTMSRKYPEIPKAYGDESAAAQSLPNRQRSTRQPEARDAGTFRSIVPSQPYSSPTWGQNGGPISARIPSAPPLYQQPPAERPTDRLIRLRGGAADSGLFSYGLMAHAESQYSRGSVSACTGNGFFDWVHVGKNI